MNESNFSFKSIFLSALIATPVFGLLCYLAVLSDASETTFAVWAVILSIATCILCMSLDDIEKNSKSKLATYDKETRTLFLHKRCYETGKLIKIKEYKHAYYKYNPAELVYTSATVGGITTGGFHVNEASHSVSALNKTDKYDLYYGNKGIIDTIKFNNTNIPTKLEKYKKGANTLYLLNSINNKELYDTNRLFKLYSATASNDLVTQSQMTEAYAKEIKLTYSECKAVKDWISGII